MYKNKIQNMILIDEDYKSSL